MMTPQQRETAQKVILQSRDLPAAGYTRGWNSSSSTITITEETKHNCEKSYEKRTVKYPSFLPVSHYATEAFWSYDKFLKNVHPKEIKTVYMINIFLVSVPKIPPPPRRPSTK